MRLLFSLFFIFSSFFVQAQTFFLDENGVTVKCIDCVAGDTGVVNGITYTAVDNLSLQNIILESESTLPFVCTSLVTSMDSLFFYNSEFNEDLSSWDVSNVLDMNNMFKSALNFNGDISNWDVSSCTNMFNMFHDAASFNSDISNWNVSNVGNMSYMFSNTFFNQNISFWNTTNVVNMDYMFHVAWDFSFDLSCWCVSQIETAPQAFNTFADFNSPVWGTCPIIGCGDETACNYNENIDCENENSCVYPEITNDLSECPPGPCNNQTSITYQGYEYDIVEIGDQCWFAENLKATQYLNNDEIYSPESSEQWWSLQNQGALCYHSNDINLQEVYGNLYNWWAVTDERGICPNGWAPPSQSDFIELINFLGGEDLSAGKLKTTGTLEEGTGLWYAPNLNATNSSGFSAIPGAQRQCSNISGGDCYDNFSDIGYFGYYWSSTESQGGGVALAMSLYSYSNSNELNWQDNNDGKSVRCVTNQLVVEIGLDYDGNGDGCVDVNDMLDLLLEYGQCEPESQLDFDGNGDGCVNGEDVLNILVEYGSCE